MYTVDKDNGIFTNLPQNANRERMAPLSHWIVAE